MDKKYEHYTVEDFSQDKRFIDWVKQGVGNEAWKEFLQEHPGQTKNIQTARKIVSAFRFQEYTVADSSIYAVFDDLEKFRAQRDKPKVVSLRRFLKYAAVVVFILAIGAAIPFLLTDKNQLHFSEEISPQMSDTDARLITAGGEQILLKNNQSDLSISTSGNQLKIDQDTTINLDERSDELAKLVVPYGKRSNLQLADGTKVWINAGSRLAFPQKFTGKERKVYLDGEAYFEVAKDNKVPFIVVTDQMDIRVYGTKFNVSNTNNRNWVEVVLVEGSVGLKETGGMGLFGKETKLVPNQRAVYDKTDRKTAIGTVDVSYYTCWTQGLFEFKKESILTVFDKLSRYYNVRFVTDGDVELHKKISGKLDLKDSLEAVLKVISDAAPVSFTIEEDKVIVTSRLKKLPMDKP
ncbi:MAG: FecR domain-containing protein [Prolixibacteraceae bacterium]